jgi:hypothetical protein
VTTLDDLELELRKLPGVRATGFTERDDVLLVQIHVGEEETEPGLPLQATRIAYRHSDRAVAVELVRWRTRGATRHRPGQQPAPSRRRADQPEQAQPTQQAEPVQRAEQVQRAEPSAQATSTGAAAPPSPPMSGSTSPPSHAAPAVAPPAQPERAAYQPPPAAPASPPTHAPESPGPAPQAGAPEPSISEPSISEPRTAAVPIVDAPPVETPREPVAREPVTPEPVGPLPSAPDQGHPEPPRAAGAPPPQPPVDTSGSQPREGGERRSDGDDEDRVRLLAVLTFPDTDELEVHLTLAARRTIGRAAASRGLLAAVEATLDGLRGFVPGLAYEPAWARTLETSTGDGFLVAAGLTGTHTQTPRHGLASGSSAIEAAARATLQALNRSIVFELATVRGESGA